MQARSDDFPRTPEAKRGGGASAGMPCLWPRGLTTSVTSFVHQSILGDSISAAIRETELVNSIVGHKCALMLRGVED